MASRSDFTIFSDDDITPLVGTVDASGAIVVASFSTDPAHPRPWLDAATEGVSQEINLIEGTATIGQFKLTVLDKRTNPTDQTTGFVTHLLAAQNGYSAVTMRRAVYRIEGPDGLMHVVQNGVISSVALGMDAVSYEFSIRDMSERARKTRLFNRLTGTTPRYTSGVSRTPVLGPTGATIPTAAFYAGDPIPGDLPAYGQCLYPPGPLNGYGHVGSLPGDPSLSAAQGGTYLMKPIRNSPIRTMFVRDRNYPTYRGQFQVVTQPPGSPSAALTLFPNDAALNAGYPSTGIDPFTGNPYSTLVYQDSIIFWRKVGSSNWHRVENMPYRSSDTAPTTSTPGLTSGVPYQAQLWNAPLNAGVPVQNQQPITLQLAFSTPNHQDLPADQTQCEILVMDGGVPSADTPLYVSATWGQLLADIYDGKYSVGYNGGPTPIITSGTGYNVPLFAQLAQSTPFLEFRKTQPESDAKAWLPEHMYKPFGAVPAFDRDGLLAPFFYRLPNANVALPQIDDSNVEYDSSKWELTSDGAVNEVYFTYTREYIQNGKITQTKKVELQFLDPTAEGIGGEKEVKYEPETLTAVIGLTNQNVHSVGDVTLDTGSRLASDRWNEVQARFRFGNQNVTLTCDRTDPQIEGLTAGAWCLVAVSWLPDFTTRTRGMNRLAQVMSVKDLDAAWREVKLADAGPAGQPAVPPTLDTLSLNPENGIVVPVTALQSGTKAVIQFAIAATVPVDSDGGWKFMGSVSAPGVVQSLPQPSGATVWVRARAESGSATGTGGTSGTGATVRSSAWVSAGSVTIPFTPVVTALELSVGFTGYLTVHIETSDATVGVRIFYAQKAFDGADPNMISYMDLPVPVGRVINTVVPMIARFGYLQFVDVFPTTAFDAVAGTISGSFGPRARAVISRVDEGTPIMPTTQVVLDETAVIGTLNMYLSDPQSRVTLVEANSRAGTEPWSGWAPALGTSSPYKAQVDLVPKQPSKIGYRVWGTDAAGNISILNEDTVTFTMSALPTAPTLREFVDAAGNFQISWDGDIDTNYIRVAASIIDYPTPSTVRAAAQQPGATGLTVPLTIDKGGGTQAQIQSGQTVFVSAIAYTVDDLEGELALAKFPYLGIGATPLPDVTIGTPIAEAARVRFPIAWDSQTTDIVAWYKVYTSGAPAAAFNVMRQSGAVALPPISVSEGITEIEVPIASSTDVAFLTLVGHDPLNQRGPVANARAAGGTPTAPAAPTAASNTTNSASVTTNSITTWKIRTRLGSVTGTFYSDTPVAVAGAGTQSISYTDVTAGMNRTYAYTMIDASGIESATGVSVGPLTTPSAAVPPAPAIGAIYDTSGQLIDVTVVPNGATPNNVTWHISTSAAAAGTFVEDSSASLFSASGTATVHLQSYRAQTTASQSRFVKVWATAGGVTGTSTAATGPVFIPAASPSGGGGHAAQ